MSRRFYFTLGLLAMASITSGVVWAQNPHYKKGPSCADNGLTASCTGTVAGLGNGIVVAELSFPNATATTTCTSPGGKQAPGQNPAAPAPVSGTATGSTVKNGSSSFTVTTEPPTVPTPEAAGCPNSKWTVTISDVSFGAGTLTITQNGQTILTTNMFLP